ncbi:hypothetical protein I4U23_018190 [Adineta vaga]|nr:hypothetical protein I4U23_018190 [Adineta vaga]
MNNTCVTLVLFCALVSCILSSYLDIPPPPERPLRFKTKEQIENYLKAVKDYYDAFKVKLVRREDLPTDLYSDLNKLSHDDDDDDNNNNEADGTDEMKQEMRLLQQLYSSYKEKHPSRILFRPKEENRVT